LVDLRRAGQGEVLFLGDDGGVAHEADEAAVIEVELHAPEAHEAGLFLVDGAGDLAEIEGDVGILLEVFRLDGRRDDAGGAVADEGERIILFADDDGLRRELGAAFAERSAREIDDETQVRRRVDDVKEIVATAAVEVDVAMGDGLGLALEEGGLEAGGRIVVGAELGVDEDEVVLHLTLELVLKHVLRGPTGAGVGFVEVVKVATDGDQETVMVVEIAGGSFGPVVVELLDRHDFVVGDLAGHDFVGQEEAQEREFFDDASLRPEVGVGRAEELQHRDVRDVVHVAAGEETGVDALRVLGEHLGRDDVVDIALDGVEFEVLGRREADAEPGGADDFGEAAAVSAEGGVGVVGVGPDRAGEKEDEGEGRPPALFR